jgi:hypothetical protein
VNTPEPVQNIYRVLCNEPFCYRPWEVDRLTPFQACGIILCKKDKKGMVVLDPPLTEEEGLQIADATEVDWLREKWRLRGLSGWALECVVRDELENADQTKKEERKHKLVKKDGEQNTETR